MRNCCMPALSRHRMRSRRRNAPMQRSPPDIPALKRVYATGCCSSVAANSRRRTASSRICWMAPNSALRTTAGRRLRGWTAPGANWARIRLAFRNQEEFLMHMVQRVSRFALISMAAIMMTACAGQKEPAQKLIGNIESTVTAASTEAAKYVPDQLADVQSKLGGLKASFAKRDYAAVVTGAPAVLSEAQNLATAAAAKKDAILKALNDQWTALAGVLPAEVTAVQNRIDLLGKKSSKKLAAGIDLDAAKAGVGDAASLWSKAQAAFAAGNLDEAVSTAADVKAKVDALAASLKLNLTAPAASRTS